MDDHSDVDFMAGCEHCRQAYEARATVRMILDRSNTDERLPAGVSRLIQAVRQQKTS